MIVGGFVQELKVSVYSRFEGKICAPYWFVAVIFSTEVFSTFEGTTGVLSRCPCWLATFRTYELSKIKGAAAFFTKAHTRFGNFAPGFQREKLVPTGNQRARAEQGEAECPCGRRSFGLVESPEDS